MQKYDLECKAANAGHKPPLIARLHAEPEAALGAPALAVADVAMLGCT